jgi:hypothetical protein
VIFRSGFFALRLSANVLDSTSNPFIIVPGSARMLHVSGIESGCFEQQSILSPQLQLLVTDSHGNPANISHFAVSARVLESQAPLASFTGFTYQNFKVNRSFCGHILFDANLTQVVGCNFYSSDAQLQAVSKPLCVVSPCNPGEFREDCSEFSPGLCAKCQQGKYASGNDKCSECARGKYSAAIGQISEDTCLVCPANSDSPAGSGAVSDCMCNAGFTWAFIPGNVSASGTCQQCAEGKYKAEAGNAACSDCGSGKYSTVVGATAEEECKSCPMNSDSPRGSSVASDCLCKAGYYKGSGACAQCPQ